MRESNDSGKPWSHYLFNKIFPQSQLQQVSGEDLKNIFAQSKYIKIAALVLAAAIVIAVIGFAKPSRQPEDYLTLGFSYLDAGEFGKALAAFNKVLEKDDSYEALIGKAKALIGLGKKDDSLVLTLKRKYSTEPEVYLLHHQLHMARQDICAAYAVLEEGYQLTQDAKLLEQMEEMSGRITILADKTHVPPGEDVAVRLVYREHSGADIVLKPNWQLGSESIFPDRNGRALFQHAGRTGQQTITARLEKLVKEIQVEFMSWESAFPGNSQGNAAGGGMVAFADDWTYYALGRNGEQGVYRMRSDGSERALLADRGVGLNVIGGCLFYIDTADGWIYKLCLESGERKQIKKVSFTGQDYYLYVANGWIYLVDSGYLFRMRPDGSERVKLSNHPTDSLTIAGTYIYYNQQVSATWYLFRMKLDGSSKTRLTTFNVSYVIADDNWLYCLNNNDSLVRLALDGKKPKRLSKEGEEVYRFNLNQGWLYFHDFQGPIYKVKIDGSGRQLLANHRALSVDVAAGWVYFHTDDYSLFRIKVDGTGLEQLK